MSRVTKEEEQSQFSNKHSSKRLITKSVCTRKELRTRFLASQRIAQQVNTYSNRRGIAHLDKQAQHENKLF